MSVYKRKHIKEDRIVKEVFVEQMKFQAKVALREQIAIDKHSFGTILADIYDRVAKEWAEADQTPVKSRRKHRRGRRSLTKLSLHKKRKKTVSEEK